VDFFPGIEPSRTTPLWVRFFSLPDSLAHGHDPSASASANMPLNATGQDVVLGNFGYVGVNEAGQKLFIHAFDLPPGAYRLELGLASHGNRIMSQQTHKTLFFTLLDFYGEVDLPPIQAVSNTPHIMAGGASHKASVAAEPTEANSGALNSACGAPLVVDAFPFFNELDLLEARLHELNNVVSSNISLYEHLNVLT